jgi:hypothetical protein
MCTFVIPIARSIQTYTGADRSFDSGTGDDTTQLQAGTYALTIRNVGGRHETSRLTGT